MTTHTNNLFQLPKTPCFSGISQMNPTSLKVCSTHMAYFNSTFFSPVPIQVHTQMGISEFTWRASRVKVSCLASKRRWINSEDRNNSG